MQPAIGGEAPVEQRAKLRLRRDGVGLVRHRPDRGPDVPETPGSDGRQDGGAARPELGTLRHLQAQPKRGGEDLRPFRAPRRAAGETRAFRAPAGAQQRLDRKSVV